MFAALWASFEESCRKFVSKMRRTQKTISNTKITILDRKRYF